MSVLTLQIIFGFLRTYKCYMKLHLGKVKIEVELADTGFRKAKGLMLRRSLPPDKGMLFVFNREAHHAIWMLGMRFPIDIVWIDGKKSIVDIVENARPCFCLLFCKVYMPKKKAKYVLEINAGFVGKNRINIGDKLRF